MKTRYIIPVLITFAAAVLLSTCKERDCGDPEYFPLKQLDKYVSYKGTETLWFLHNSTDTQYFVGEGIKKLVVTTHPPKEDGGECSEEHESMSVQFRNHRTNAVIKIEYIYDRLEFGGAKFADDPYTYIKLYYKNHYIGKNLGIIRNDTPYPVNDSIYTYVGFFGESIDTTSYIAYTFPMGKKYGGVIKIKYPGDTLTLIK